MAVGLKSFKIGAALALSMVLFGCGKAHITITSNKGAVTSLQTANGTLQVTSVSRSFIGDQYSTDYQISFVITQAGRTVKLDTYATPDQNGSATQNFGSDFYAVRTACANTACDTFAALFNYGNFQGSTVQFAVLYKSAADGSGSITKLNEEFDTNFNSVYDAMAALVNAI